ncbi:YrhA family protein [Virgibacillus halodenitrificans]|uniref:YrhA family protein n=1 Tax=Virgibacillus halodenitrificans TaxID=1482 RepID=UPI001F454070|nr:YrhA family protein [Virgibacillus halodenitrificans]
MAQWKDFLVEIGKIEAKYGSSLRNPASEIEIEKMDHNIQQKWGNISLPKSYIELLKKVNGLDFNGLVIYGVDKNLLDKKVEEDIHGFIETNELWHENEWQKKYTFFGDSDRYCFAEKECVYVELDKPSGTLIQSFESFGAMLSDAFETIIS